MNIKDYIAAWGDQWWPASQPVWTLPSQVPMLIKQRLAQRSNEYIIRDEMAIHHSAVIEPSAVLKGRGWIGAGCFIAAHTYLRGGVILLDHVIIGPGCELKSSIVFSHTTLAHFNFVGDSIIGSHVNVEAGAVIANHYNEREDKAIHVRLSEGVIATGVTKFGAVVGDRCKIGANAVLSPGTVLTAATVVGRLQLV